jgi:hypothetical protein
MALRKAISFALQVLQGSYSEAVNGSGDRWLLRVLWNECGNGAEIVQKFVVGRKS